MDINSFFDKIYCINLDDRIDRWVEVKKQFDELGITNVERFSAIKKEPGYLGCLESHVSVIKKAKELNYKSILVFEDDVNFINKDINLINETLNQLNTMDWDLFYLGATVTPKTKLIKKTNNIVKTNFAYTTHAYAINNTVFDEIINNAPRFRIIDVFYSNTIVQKGKSFIMNPMVCLQKPGYSDIEKKEINYDWMISHFDQALKNNS
jgi:GR25 family glycosyltransferase involved in LPS biosynthesis